MKTFEQKELNDWVDSIYEPVHKINRIQFLIQEIQAIKQEMREEIDREKELDFLILLEDKGTQAHRFYLLSKERGKHYLEKLVKSLKSHEYQLKVAQGQVKPNKDTITDEMIERAKEFPIRDLIHATNDVVTKCPFHNDKTASMNIKNNFAYCHGCGWTGDTIKIYQTIHSATFPEAVKYLSRM